MDIPRVYFPCVYVPATDYRQTHALLIAGKETITVRVQPCRIAPGVCSVFRVFEDKFKYSKIQLDYSLQPPTPGHVIL